jgi:PPM family protein phosphatase
MDPDATDKVPVPTNDNAENNASGDQENGARAQEVGWQIDKGLVRQSNEDSLAAVTLSQASEAESQSVGVYAVADGMGGHDAGEVASKLAVRTAIRKLMEDVTEADEVMPDNYQHWLKGAVALANQIVRNKAQEDAKNMGTTLVMAVVVGHDVHIVNVGDSRAYLISPRGIRKVTHDHSFVQALVDNGAITQEEAANHPHRNILTQSVGSQEEITIDLFNETISDDEYLLLCSDGLWEMLSDEEIWRIVRRANSPSEACQQLVEATNTAGGYDNIAAVLVRLGNVAARVDAMPDPDDTEKLPRAKPSDGQAG